MVSIIMGLGATVTNGKEMSTASFSGFIGGSLASAIGELLTMWSDKLYQSLLGMWPQPPFSRSALSARSLEKALVVQSLVRVVDAEWLSTAISFASIWIYDRRAIY
ncbi:hypothetical protein CRG98_026100 [Punica granatum]|uniref:Uncharacterized protein n=1 Tax=Punica granatum TaxID=22663 RepID=A0A2I0JB80_PUNGR|nr:hypothetical protein CRG98_026100 [Punica granatum]